MKDKVVSLIATQMLNWMTPLILHRKISLSKVLQNSFDGFFPYYNIGAE